MYHGDNAPSLCVLAVRTTKVAIGSAGTTSDGMRSTALRHVQALGSQEMTGPRCETKACGTLQLDSVSGDCGSSCEPERLSAMLISLPALALQSCVQLCCRRCRFSDAVSLPI